jgi:hypothetical protein
MHVKMTRIESGVTVPKGLFTLYMNVKIVSVTHSVFAYTQFHINVHLSKP